MVHLEWETDRRNGVTFVSAIVHNEQPTPQTVRLESRFDGPTWSPRGDADTALEWDGDLWTGTIAPKRHRGVGFATPAAPVEPPLELVDASRTSDTTGTESEAVVQSLDEWQPPRDVLTRIP
ncbi:DUF7857 domain-containing protein [Natronorubrum sulfidifaciens]|uniref:Uncharacterized protein n=1 Tax=Natronorubrum sulfidifaciens JCM 14089 TaxID=1230460 RepID=L9WJM3_9EURY|nr:hypothetical protein [Natronorubrum sulfidifaciens]ELY49421.1 hypothetical protein C495_00610 [Natronorubrum sulfidifaciens JCM 14089]